MIMPTGFSPDSAIRVSAVKISSETRSERKAADEAAERSGTPPGRRRLADHDHADGILAGQRDTGERGEDQQRDQIGAESRRRGRRAQWHATWSAPSR